ncbi:MAG: PqqA family [Pseudomonadota bacterium]|jgi:coenzyme PQQ precursor peptide PqqA
MALHSLLIKLFSVSHALLSSNFAYDLKNLETIMWTKPAATEMRFGFEVTMYVMNK